MKIIYCIFILFLSSTSFSQPAFIPQELNDQLRGKSKLSEYVKTIYNYYGLNTHQILDSINQSKIEKSTLRSLKFWNRWAYFMSSRLGDEGKMVDVNSMWIKNSDRNGENNKLETRSTSSGNWTFVGPTTMNYGSGLSIGIGRVDRIAFHPTDPDTYFVSAAEGGLWKTIDGGDNYICLTDHLPIIGASGIVVDYSNPNIIYLLSGNGDNNFMGTGDLVSNFRYKHACIGVFKSTDGGKSWKVTGNLATPGLYNAYQIVQSPTNPNVLLVATSRGIFRTSDGGNSWVPTTMSGRFADVKFKPNSGSVAYAVGSPGTIMQFFRSADGGISWIPSNFDMALDTANRCSIGVSPANDQNVYLLCGPSYSKSRYYGFYLSTNEGRDFIRTNNSPSLFLNEENEPDGDDQSAYDNCIAIHPTADDYIIVGGTVVWRSTNKGNSFTQLTRYDDGIANERTDYIHPDVHAIAYNPLNNLLYACTDGGVYSSNNNGLNWRRRFNTLGISQIYHMDRLPGSDIKFMIGNQDNGIQTRYGDNSGFIQNHGGDAYDVDFVSDDEDQFYAVTNTEVKKFTFSGTIPNSLIDFAPAFFPSLAISLTNNRRILVGDPRMARFYSIGLNILGLVKDVTISNVPASWYILQSPSNTNRYYIAGEKGYFEADSAQVNRTDGDGIYTRLDQNPGFPNLLSLQTRITCMAVHPADHKRLWVSFGGFTNNTKIFYSNNSGNSWQNLSGSLPNLPVNSLAVDDDGNVYAGTDDGVFFRGDKWKDWKPFYNGLPRVPITELILTSNNYVYASTFGRGVWRSEQYSDCPATLNVTGEQNGQKFFEASSTINTSGKSTSGDGTQVYYRAGDKIDLKEGFIASNESEVKIYNGPCASGVPVFLRSKTSVDTEFKNFRKAVLPIENKVQFPYAFIREWTNRTNTKDFNIDIVQEGKVRLILTDKDGNKIRDLWAGNLVGTNKATISIPEIKTKECSVLLFHNDLLVHWQDLN